MTLKELWHIKINTRVSAEIYGKTHIGTVVSRFVDSISQSFIIGRNRTTGEIFQKDIGSKQKYLTIKVVFDNGEYRYYDTLPPFYRLDKLKII